MKKLHKESPLLNKQQLIKQSGDPVMSKYHPLKYFGAISEKMNQQLDQYLKNDLQLKVIEKQGGEVLKSKFKPIKGETFKKMYFLKYMKSVVNPGENVGTLAG